MSDRHVPNAAQARQSHAAGRFRTPLAKFVENVATVDEIAIAGEGDGGERLRGFLRTL
jgi:hypothetical protein